MIISLWILHTFTGWFARLNALLACIVVFKWIICSNTNLNVCKLCNVYRNGMMESDFDSSNSERRLSFFYYIFQSNWIFVKIKWSNWSCNNFAKCIPVVNVMFQSISKSHDYLCSSLILDGFARSWLDFDFIARWYFFILSSKFKVLRQF